MLFNKSFGEIAFSSYWKEAHVLPLFKKDDPSLPCNYRIMSLLSCVSKVMERIMFKHVYNVFHKNNLFYKYQAGFLPGHSTVFQLLETYHSNVKSIDDGKFCCMVFCDLSKASCLNYIQMESEAMYFNGLQMIFLVIVKNLCLMTSCLQVQV
jgi:hypothetical protein